MRIVHLVKKYPDVTGGDGIVVKRLRDEQVARGHEVTVITSRCPEVVAEPGVVQFGLRSSSSSLDGTGLRRLASLAWLGITASWYFARLRPEVIHTHTMDFALVVSRAAARHDVPIVHTCHDLATDNPHTDSWKPRVERWLYAKARLSKVIALTDTDARRLERLTGAAVSVIGNGAD